MEAKSVTFDTNDDFEFGRGNNVRSCNYQIYNGQSGKGLVVYIPGFGSDLGTYTEAFCKKIAQKYDVATMYVEYFAMASRPNVGAKIQFDTSETLKVNRVISEMGGTPGTDINKNLEILDQLTKASATSVTISGSLVPPHGHYQNFGILPALDILNGIRDAITRYGLDKNNIILVGSSYGGYIANMVTKLSPGTIRGVFDNSSWAHPNLKYVVGRELSGGEYSVMMSKYIRLGLCMISPWTLATGLPNSFEKSRLLIRSFTKDQIEMMASQGGKSSTSYYFYHSHIDDTAPTKEKIEMSDEMRNCGCRVKLKIVGEEDVDGVLVKELSHGLGMSMVAYFEVCMSQLESEKYLFESVSNSNVNYVFEDCRYEIDLTKVPINASITYN